MTRQLNCWNRVKRLPVSMMSMESRMTNIWSRDKKAERIAMRKKHRKLYNKIVDMNCDGSYVVLAPMTVMEILDLWKDRIFFNMRNLFGHLLVYFREYEWIPVTDWGWKIAKKRDRKRDK